MIVLNVQHFLMLLTLNITLPTGYSLLDPWLKIVGCLFSSTLDKSCYIAIEKQLFISCPENPEEDVHD